MTTPMRTTTLALARAGSKSAFEQLVVEQERLVLRTAWRLLGVREDAQDAAQEVFLRLYKNVGKLRDDTAIEAWLYRVTVNVCQDTRRKRSAQVFEDLPRAAVENEFEIEQQTAAVAALLAELPDKERAALVLREIEGLTTREVAGILGSSEVTVRTQIASARSKLKAWLKEGRWSK